MVDIYNTAQEAGSAIALISLQKIKKNLTEIKKRAPTARCMPVFKANAYGLGAEEIALALLDEIEGCFVATAAEGRNLMSFFTTHHHKKEIFVLHGFLPKESHKIAKSNLIPVINTLEQAEEWGTFYPKKACAIQIDSGMNRLGLSEGVLTHKAIQGLNIVLVLSHLACASDQENSYNHMQLTSFLKVSKAYFPNIPKSIAASEGVLLGESFHLDVIRPGISLYGAVTENERSFLKNAVSLQAPVFQILEHESGQSFGYGRSWIAKRKTLSATLGIGYADCCLSSRNAPMDTFFWKKKIAFPIIGRVSMDSVIIDVTEYPKHVRVGDFVELLGDDQSLMDLATQCGITAHEVLTSIGHRVIKKYLP